MPPETPFVAIILAAQRRGIVDPLAMQANVSHKCLSPVAGVPMIRHVAAMLAEIPEATRLRIVVEPEAMPAIRAALSGLPRIDYVPAADNLADSVHAAAEGIAEPLLVTTADHVLLTHASIDAVMRTLTGGAEVAIALAPRSAVLAAHPEGQRRFYRFANDEYSNCNLYGLAGPRSLTLVESFRSGGHFHRNPVRLLGTFGPLTLLLFRFGRLSLGEAARRISRRFRVRLEPVVLTDGSQAIDVDNARTLAIVESLLAARLAA